MTDKPQLCHINDWTDPIESRKYREHKFISDGEYWTCCRCLFAYKKDDSRVLVGDDNPQITTVM